MSASVRIRRVFEQGVGPPARPPSKTKLVAESAARGILKQPIVSLLLLTAFAVLAKQVQAFVPGVPLPVITLGFGILLGNIVERSVRDAPKRLPFEVALAFGMILLGAQIDGATLQLVGVTGVFALLFHWLMMGALFALAIKLGLFSKRTGALLATGMSGAGISAVIASAASDPQATREDVGLGTAVILACGALGLIVLPEIGQVLGMDAASYARWVGVVMPTTAESVIAGARHSEEAFRATGAYRLLVNLLIGLPVLIYLARFGPKQERSMNMVKSFSKSLFTRMPPFVWGLALLGVIGVFGFFEAAERRQLGNLTNWAFAVTLVGVGYQTRPIRLWRLGWKTILACLCVWIVGAASMLLLPWL